MAKLTVLENPSISLYYHPESRIVHHQIHRYTSGSLLWEANEAGIRLLTEHRACKWLSDDRSNGPLTAEDLRRAQERFAPAAVAAGWRYWALVAPEKPVALMSMRRFQSGFARAGISVRTFREPEGAMAWLLEVDQDWARPVR